jgi:hypothetical protein
MTTKPIRERRECPPEFQERITRMFGVNQFGDPLYKITWAQDTFHVMGGPYFTTEGYERIGYRDRYQGSPYPAWQIMRWKSPKEYGTPGLWYAQTYLDEWDIYLLGPYPWRGRYEILYQLFRKEFVGNELKIIPLPLTHTLIDKIIPLMIESQHLSVLERQAAAKLAKEYEHRQAVNEIADRMMSDLPAWYGPVSFSKQGVRTNLLDRMMDRIKKRWDATLSGHSTPPQFQRGMFQGNKPMLA